MGVNAAGMDLLGPLGELFYQGLLVLRGLADNSVVFHFRGRQVQLVGSLDVGHLLEDRHELGQVEEPGEAGPGPVAGALGGQLQGRDRLAEPGGPAVERAHTHLHQAVVLEIPLDGIALRHGVADGRAGGEDHAAAAGDLVQVAALGEHVAGLLGLGAGKPCHIPHFGVEEQW